MKHLVILLAVVTMVGSVMADSFEPVMPSVSGRDLNGKPWSVPDGLPGERTIVLVGFDEPQQAAIDTWARGLGLSAANNRTPWIEMPVIDDPGALMRWFINTGMRGGIQDRLMRARVWTAYTDKAAFLKACHITSDKEACAFVVDRQGRILAAAAGSYTEAAAAKLMEAIGIPTKFSRVSHDKDQRAHDAPN